MYRNGKRLSVSEMRNILIHYNEEAPEIINDLIENFKFHTQDYKEIFTQYCFKNISLKSLVEIYELKYQSVISYIYRVLEYIIINYEIIKKEKNIMILQQLNLRLYI